MSDIETLASQRDEALAELKKAREEITDLKRRLSEVSEELHSKNLDVEFLTLSHKLAQTPGALAEARTTVRRMIAKVDKAIALLKEDARI